MLALLGFITIASFLIIIITRKMSVITALIMVPLVFGLMSGAGLKELSAMMLDGLKQVAPTGILLMFAVLYFSIMLDAGLFDPVIAFIIRRVNGDPLKVVMGTAILTMIVHLDGDGTATFMIVVTAFLPIYKLLRMNRLVLAGVVALGVGPLHLVPWSGTSARAMATMKSNATEIFNPNIPSMIAGITWVLVVAYLLGSKERKRLGIVSLDYHHHSGLTEEQRSLRRPRLTWINALLTMSMIIVLMTGWLPTPVLFVVASAVALLINYPALHNQQKIIRSHGANIFMVSSLIFAAGIFSGILNGSGMISAMTQSLVHLVPDDQARWLPLITALTSMPASLVFTPDSYYFGVVPVLADTATHFGINGLEIARAGLLGQMTVGFPLSPLTASTFLLIGLCEVDLGEHQKFTWKWAMGTTIIMTIAALATGSIHI